MMFDLTGKYIHWQINGELGNWGQGYVVGNMARKNQEPLWVVQLFSWVTGEATNKTLLTNAELADGFVRIYDDIDDWQRKGDRLPDAEE